VVGVEETLERPQGKKIGAKGIYRDPVRSSYTHFVETSALRWVCLALLVPIAWASGVFWALPFLSALTPSERYTRERGKRHKKLAEWAWQLAFAGEALAAGTRADSRRRWRICVFGTPRSLPTLEKADHVHHSLVLGCSALYEPAPPRYPGQIGRPRLKGERLPNLSVVAEDRRTDWTPIVVADWYGREKRTVEVVSATALWYSSGLAAVPLRWVLIEDPEGEFDTQALC